MRRGNIPEKQDISQQEKNHGKRGIDQGLRCVLFVSWEE
jgi:hypothetical protein